MERELKFSRLGLQREGGGVAEVEHILTWEEQK